MVAAHPAVTAVMAVSLEPKYQYYRFMLIELGPGGFGGECLIHL
jgi:hypothetical protein